MTTALIVGAGIAGTATAMALRKAGIDVTIYEEYSTGADDVGAFLTLALNGTAALRAIDADNLVADVGFAAMGMEVFSGTGKKLGAVPMGGPAAAPRTIRRADLYRALHDEAVRRGVHIEHGKRLVTATTMAEGGVVATFADGSTAEGDLLVGADGIHSVVRTLIDESAPNPSYTGLVNVYGYTDDKSMAVERNSYRMIYGKRAFFGCTTDPQDQTWWFVNLPISELSRSEIASTTAAEWKARAAAFFRRDHSCAVQVIRSTGEDVFASNGYELPTVPVWHTGSMVVIGDAAHAASPSSAQGASMAVEDAVVLAKCLRDVPEVDHALRAYDRERRERVERVVAMGAQSNNRKMPGLIKRILRDRTMPKLLSQRRSSGRDWLRSHSIDWESPITPEEHIAAQ